MIESALAGRNTLAIMPTGAGKSLCYQLPALLMPGLTLVISPLIALMKDQTDKLDQLGLGASQVNSGLTSQETEHALDAIEREVPEFVLTTPERLTRPDFIEKLRGVTIDLIVIDEAHCISQWGHDFRTAYLDLARAIKTLAAPPVLALTATATAETIEDIRKQLDLDDLAVFNTGIYRPNLEYEVIGVETEEMKQTQIIRLLRELDGIGIVYTSTVRDVETLTTLLSGLGLPVARYHGRLGIRERHDTQERFMRGELKAIIATSAFGMGIDKKDIRFVVHYNIPGSVDAYYQESGRAGRDGVAARTILLYQPSDRRTHLFFLGRRYPRLQQALEVQVGLESLRAGESAVTLAAIQETVSTVPKTKVRAILAAMVDMDLVSEEADGRFRLLREDVGDAELERFGQIYETRTGHERGKIDQMVAYAQSALCRWKMLLQAFGDTPEWSECNHCDNCRRGVEREVREAAAAAAGNQIATAPDVIADARRTA